VALLKKSALVSLCIPSFNGERFIPETLKSVLDQTLADFEVLIVDDASSDGSMTILRKVQDPRVRIERNSRNLGMDETWNRLVSNSSGKYVKLLCGDDLLDQDCLAKQVSALEQPANANAVLAICNRRVINAAGEVVFRRKFPFPPGLIDGPRLIRSSIRWGTNVIGEPAVGLFRREVLERGVKFRPNNPYLIDLAFWADVLRHGGAFIDSSYLASFRISEGAVSSRVGWRQSQAFRKFAHGLTTDPVHKVSRVDCLFGSCLALQWCLLRNLFRKFKAKRNQNKSESHAQPVGSSSMDRVNSGHQITPRNLPLNEACARNP
jgi:glycosyltransferase involved in cell wall biosynthesis